jgi:hypothetical protein
MKNHFVHALAGIVILLTALVSQGADTDAPYPPPPPSTGQQLSEPQLEQLLAPIALYSDPLLAQILMAATYPLEVVQADRWVQDPNNAALKGDQLAAALDTQPWDPSVKSLVPFPQILRMMDNNLTWTEQLGDAFLAGQAEVMDAVQQLRQKAQAYGTLQTTPQQVVATSGNAITIEPASPEVVYVPVYDPVVAYGPWPYANWPPYYFPDVWGVVPVGYFGFGWVGVGINLSFWGWCGWDWGNHGIYIDGGHFNGRIPRRGPPPTSGPWRHNPGHRGGVPYSSGAVRARFGAESGNAGRSYRGYPDGPASRPAPASSLAPMRIPEGGPGRVERAPAVPPIFQSFGRGNEIRGESDRGHASRQSMPAPSPAPAPRGGQAGGGRRH